MTFTPNDLTKYSVSTKTVEINVSEPPPEPPGGFRIVPISSDSVILEWDSSANSSGYNIYYRTESGSYGAPINAGSNTTYIMPGLNPGQTYYFEVTGYNGSGESIHSEEVSSGIPYAGSLDLAFGTGGVVVDEGVGNAVTVDSSGRILVAGKRANTSAGYEEMVIWCYDSSGNPCDYSGYNFGQDGNGVATFHNPTGGTLFDEGFSVAIDPSNRILVTGQPANTAGNADMIIWRYTDAGILDTTFGDIDGAQRKGYTVHMQSFWQR